MSLIHLVYASHPFGFDEAMLNGILLDARRCNERDEVTGALIARGDLYLQLIEGSEPAVLATYDRILRDDRHANATLLVQQRIENRMFPGWAMLDDPAESCVWTIEQVRSGAVAQASEAEALAFFQQLAKVAGAPPNQVSSTT